MKPGSASNSDGQANLFKRLRAGGFIGSSGPANYSTLSREEIAPWLACIVAVPVLLCEYQGVLLFLPMSTELRRGERWRSWSALNALLRSTPQATRCSSRLIWLQKQESAELVQLTRTHRRGQRADTAPTTSSSEGNQQHAPTWLAHNEEASAGRGGT